jgi:hypothetical protein
MGNTTKTKPDRAAIRAFLCAALADGAVPVRDLESQARAAGLLAEGLPISQSRPIRRVADKLHTLRFREDDKWWWRLPMTSSQDAVKVTAPVSVPVPAPDPSPAPSVQDDIVAARRKFAEQSLKEHMELARRVAPRARAAVDRYLQTGDLADLFPTEH